MNKPCRLKTQSSGASLILPASYSINQKSLWHFWIQSWTKYGNSMCSHCAHSENMWEWSLPWYCKGKAQYFRGVALGVEFEIGKGGHLRPLAATCRKRPLAATCGQSGCKWLQVTANNEIHCPWPRAIWQMAFGVCSYGKSWRFSRQGHGKCRTFSTW